MSETFEVSIKTKKAVRLRRTFFESIKNEVLGKDYELSLAFVEEDEMHILNRERHGKDKPTNILSFPLEKTSGEIIICPPYAEKEAADFDRTYENYLQFLFIHGLVHLKGFDHGSTMDHEEAKIRLMFDV